MTDRVVVAPYLRPRADRISTGPWTLSDMGGEALLTERLPHWDYNTPIKASRTVTIDLNGLREDCQLPESTPLRLAAGWHSTGTQLRGAGSFVDLDRLHAVQTLSVAVAIEGNLLSDEVRLLTRVILPKGIASAGPLSARIAGSVLWEDDSRVLLEGVAGRFPVEVVDFTKSTILPPGAGWFLDWDPTDLAQPALRAARLVINAAHPRVVKAVSASSPDAEDQAVISAIYFDVGRALVLAALRDPAFRDGTGLYPDGSIGREIERLVTTVFPGDSPRGLGQILSERPVDMELLLQDRLRLFHEQ